MPKAHPADLRARAIATAAARGVTAAAKEHGVDKGTVSRWCVAAGVATVATEWTRNATEAARHSWEQRRAELANDLGLLASESLQVIRANLTVKPRTASDLARVLAVAIDKAQLLSGAPTSRTEHVEPIDVELARLVAEMKTRA